MKLPSENQIKAGNRACTEMYNASITKCLGDTEDFDIEHFEFKDIVMMYLNEEIDSVTGIFLAMNSVE